VKLLFWPPYR